MPDFINLLSTLPVTPIKSLTLRRLVAREALDSGTSPDYLFTSGRPGRVHSLGTRALYGSEDATTAGAEWERQAARSPRLTEHVLYPVEAHVVCLDLEPPDTLTALQLTLADLSAPWQFVSAPTTLQILGDAVAKQTRFGAIRFFSDAARVRGFVGFNLVMFPTALVAPMSVVIRDDAGNEIQRWP